MTSSLRPSVGPLRARLAPLLLLLLLLLVVAGALVRATPAEAHATLLGTDPADGSTLATPPTRVSLTFDEPAQALGTEIVVLGPDGSTVSTGAPELVDSTVAQALVADLPAGVYTVQWRVTSADGHPLSGELTFTAAAGTAPDPTPTPDAAPAATSTPDPTEEVAPVAAAPSPEATVSAQQEAVEDEDAGLEAGVVAAIVVAVLAAGAVTVFVVRERRRSKDARTDG